MADLSTETKLARILGAWAFYQKAKADPNGVEVGAVRDGLEWVLEEVRSAAEEPSSPPEPSALRSADDPLREPLDGPSLGVRPPEPSVEPGTPGGYLHEIWEPDGSYSKMYNVEGKNPWSHWVAQHMDRCQYRCTPLYPAYVRSAPEPPVKPVRILGLCDKHQHIGHFPAGAAALPMPPIETVCPWCEKQPLTKEAK